MSRAPDWRRIARLAGAAAIAVGLGVAVRPAMADRDWDHFDRWHQRHYNGPRVVLGFNSTPYYYRPYYAPPPVYYAPPPGTMPSTAPTSALWR